MNTPQLTPGVQNRYASLKTNFPPQIGDKNDLKLLNIWH